MIGRPLVRLNRSYGWDKWELRYGRLTEEGVILVAQAVTMAEVAKGKEVPPCMYLEAGECQLLMDELYATGFRPTEGKDSIGAMKATENHLEDMKKIAFFLLNKGKK